MAKAKQNDAVATFWDALDALTYRQMLDVAGLIAMTLADRKVTMDGDTVAAVLADACDAFQSAEDEG